jgi:demethylmenaquinone methyltransferase/2-methoxy-6-polyprenyl-1,4-benzoquinol methylase
MRRFHYRSRPTANHSIATEGLVLHWANLYDPLVNLLTLGHRKDLRQRTVALARLTPGETVLEVGCGTGDVSLAASAKVGPGGTVLGIDPAPEMIEVARQKARRMGSPAQFQVGVIEALALPDHSVDTVLSSLMMHHLPDDLKRRGLAEIARVLRPGGRLLIVDFKLPSNWLERTVNHITLHGSMGNGVQELPPLLQETGFTSIETGATGVARLGFVRAQTPH